MSSLVNAGRLITEDYEFRSGIQGIPKLQESPSMKYRLIRLTCGGNHFIKPASLRTL